MEEDGALLEPRAPRQRVSVGPLPWGTERTGTPGPEPDPATCRDFQAAVIKALASATGPLRARDVHAAAQIVAQEPLSLNTVKDCLHKNARRPDGPIERVGHGLYRRR